MIVEPKIRGFICTTAHPEGCAQHVANQIALVRGRGPIANGPKKVLVVGSSTGYGLSSRIAAAFGCGAATIGVFFEKAAEEKRTGTAGWYNSAAFEKEAAAAGLYARSFNGDAFSNDMKREVIEAIKADPKLTLAGVQRALVIGGGNTAIDIAHELKLLGVNDVAMVYRRGEADMSGYGHELAYARKHGVRLLEHRVVSEYHRDGGKKLTGVKLSVAKDGKPVSGGEETLSCELVALAIGQATATGVAKAFPGVEVDKKGRVVVDAKTHRTGNAKVWSGGDCVNGGKEIVNAAADGKRAALDICRQLA
jgi:NADH dehydrogenase FAD-containing subunit